MNEDDKSELWEKFEKFFRENLIIWELAQKYIFDVINGG